MKRFLKFRHAAKRAAMAHSLGAGAIAVVVLVVSSSGGVAVAQAGASSAAPSPGWPQLHYGPDRTGYQPNETQIGTGNISQLALARTYPAAASPSAPLIANGILYVDTGTLYAFDATGVTNCSAAPATCTPLWTAPTAYFDGMTIADGKVFVTDAEGVQAFDAAGATNCSGAPKVCAPLWATSTHTATGPVFTPGSGSPLVVGGVLYVPGYGDGLPLSTGGAYVAAFDAAGSTGCSGSPVVCVPMWTTTGPPASTANTGSPAIANGVLYIANQTLYAFDAAGSANCSGTPAVCAPLWTAATSNNPTYSAPAVANGTVYVGSWDAKLYAFDAAGATNCSASATGKTCTPLWTAATPSNIGGTPAVANGVVYAVSGDGTLSAFDAGGTSNCSGTVTTKTCTPLWSSAPGPTGYVTFSSPAVANGVVYFSSTDGGTYAYDAGGSLNCSVSTTAAGTTKTCLPLWSAVTGKIGGGSPAIANGVLYINVSGNGTIYAYALGRPATQPTAVTTSLSGGGQSGTSIQAPARTAVTDTAILSGTNASTATGTITYNVYSDSACTVTVNAGTAQAITTPGTLPASNPITLSTPGTYYWQASYSGDATNGPSTSTCGTAGEVETVVSACSYNTPPSWTTSAVGGLTPGVEPLNVIISGCSTVSLKDIRKGLGNWGEVTPACLSSEQANVTGTFVNQQQSWRLKSLGALVLGTCLDGNRLSLDGTENHARIWNQPIAGTHGAWFISASYETLCVDLFGTMVPGEGFTLDQLLIFKALGLAWHCIDGSQGSIGTDGYNRGASDFVSAIQAAAGPQKWAVNVQTISTPPGIGEGHKDTGVPFSGTVYVVTVDHATP